MYTIVGLGNPGDEYKETRHNTGRIVLEMALKNFDFSDFKIDNKIQSLTSDGKIAKQNVKAIEPDTFMNKSGNALKSLIKVKPEKKPARLNDVSRSGGAKELVVIHDDLDLPIGTARISFNRGSGGHKGVESIIKAIKTEKFVRIKIGISPKTPTGKIKKPKSEKVGDFILAKFKPEEMSELKKVAKKVAEALEVMIKEDVFKAMTEFN